MDQKWARLPEMGQEWIRNGSRLSEMGQEWIKNGPYYQKWARNGTEIGPDYQKWVKNGSNYQKWAMDQKWVQIVSERVRNESETDPNNCRKYTQFCKLGALGLKRKPTHRYTNNDEKALINF